MSNLINISRTLNSCPAYKLNRYVVMIKKYAGDPVEQVKTINLWAFAGLITPAQKDVLYTEIG